MRKEFKDYEILRQSEHFEGTLFYESHFCFRYRMKNQKGEQLLCLYVPVEEQYKLYWEVCRKRGKDEIFGWIPLKKQPQFEQLPEWFQYYVEKSSSIIK